jgi:PhoH-like ATPase
MTTHRKKSISENERKIFVLDTSVILYDHTAIRNFKDNDVVIPITVLEELDNFKKGNDTKNFAAREFIRYIDKQSGDHTLQDWIPINGRTTGRFKIEMHTDAKLNAEKIFDEKKPDHKILNTTIYLQEKYPNRKVILVTKDINLRIKAKSLNILAEDYETGKIKEVEELYTGKAIIEKVKPSIIQALYEHGECDAKQLTRQRLIPNQYLILKNTQQSVLARCYY